MQRFLLALILIPAVCFSQTGSLPLTIHFDSGSYSLDEVRETKMFSDFLAEGVIVESIEIEGYCDDIGTEQDNLILSGKRAEAAADFINKNFAYKINSVAGKGEIKTLSNNAASDEMIRAQNRRATVFIRYSITEKPAATNPVDVADSYEGYKTIKDSLAPGDKLILRHILFVGGRTVFEDQEEADAELETLVAYFAQNPNVQFAINGHVCCITHAFWDARDLDSGKNNLSETRAKKIFDYFVEKGIDPARMSHQGHGRKFPRKNVAEQLNKRVEIVILKI